MSEIVYIEKLMKKMNVREGGVLFNRFYIKKKIGEGSFGYVYKAVDYKDNASVAVKLSFGDGMIKQRNLIEAKLLKNLNRIRSNLIVHMKTYFVMEECVIIVLELLPCNLIDIIRDNFFENNKMSIISVYAKQMIEFLGLCSRCDLIHCDIKPDNILVHKNNHQIKFADFGMAHCPLVEHENRLIKIQTLNYRAPEVLLGFDYFSSVDMWSVGCVLMECFIGNTFFFAKDELHLMEQIANIFGIIHKEAIEDSDKRDAFFYYNCNYEQWLVKGFQNPVQPLGLINFVKKYHPHITIDHKCLLFLDLIKGMMHLYPELRFTPEMCMDHPFFKL